VANQVGGGDGQSSHRARLSVEAGLRSVFLGPHPGRVIAVADWLVPGLLKITGATPSNTIRLQGGRSTSP
jgi:hypothetical protein